MDFKKRADETVKEYKYRMYKNKDVYNLKNDEIGEIVNRETGESFDESAHRKWATPYIDGFDTGYEKGFNDGQSGDVHELSAELDEKRDELYKQQVKTRDKYRELRKSLRDEARIENLQDIFIECANILSRENPIHIDAPSNSKGERIAILQLSDWHYGEIVDDFLNTYNKTEFDQRIEKLTNDTINYCKLMNVKTLKVLNQGDLISGNIHVSSRVNSEENVIEQTMYVSETLAIMLSTMATSIEEVEFYSVLDNHSRINKSKFEHIEKESFGMFIPWFLQTRLSSVRNVKIMKNRINECEDLNIGVVNIFHEKAFFSHGHQDRVASVIQDLTLMTRIFPISVFLGHLHQNMEKEVHGIDMIMNPSLIGSGEYSKSIRKTSRPRQKLTIYENNDGNVERVSTFFINL